MTTVAPSIAYFNGDFKPLDQVHISPLDRGFLFADGVYEMIPVYQGRTLGLAGHLRRLAGGLQALSLDSGLTLEQWDELLNELVARNGGGDLAIYLQITRGFAPVRDHRFPSPPVPPTVFAMASSLKSLPETLYQEGIAALTLDDIRWGACHIKSTALLANVLARQQALDRDADDAILVRDGLLTEGPASNLFLVSEGMILTPVKDHRILPGITRDIVLQLLVANDIPYQEQDIPVATLEAADEIWLTSSTKEIVPVTRLNGQSVGDGVPGPQWRRVMDLYQFYKREVCDPDAEDV